LSFDVERFYNDYNIPYFTEGKNVQTGWINVRCPLCFDDSNHLGYNLEKDYFNCWKCGRHTNYEVIEALTGFNSLQIRRILLDYQTENVYREKLKKEKQTISFQIPKEWQPLKRIHKQYLTKRNYDADFLEMKYGLKATGHLGNYAFRIAIPIYYNNKIVSFTARDYTGKQDIRYKSCPKDQEEIYHKTILYNLDNCKEDWCIVVEGPFDAFRMGDNCCATFGTGFTYQQISLLAKRFKYVAILFDSEEEAKRQAVLLGNNLAALGVKIFRCLYASKDNKDPGEMSQFRAEYLKNHIMKGLLNGTS